MRCIINLQAISKPKESDTSCKKVVPGIELWVSTNLILYISYLYRPSLNHKIRRAVLRSELSAARVCTGKVGCIMGIAFGSGINNKKTSRGDDLVVAVIVERLTVL